MEASVFKEIRVKMGLTQWDLGKKLGVTQASVYLYEQGKRNIPTRVEEIMIDIDIFGEPVAPVYKGKKVQLSFGMQPEWIVAKIKEIQGNRTNREFLESLCV